MESKPSGRALRAVVIAGACLAIFAALAASASAKVLTHGQFIHVTRHLNSNQSNNWFGYNQGPLEQGSKQFHSITGDWTVPDRHASTPPARTSPRRTGSGSAAAASTPPARSPTTR